MKGRELRYIFIAVLVTVTLALPACLKAEEAAKPKEEELSIYGEVQAVNLEASSIKIQYYDYDTDEERSIDIVSGKDTKIENAAALNEIREGDWVDVTYSSAEGKNTAKTIIVEREESPAEEEAAESVEEE